MSPQEKKAELRRGYFLGVTPGEWIMIITMFVGGTAAVTTYAGIVDENTTKVNKVTEKVDTEVPKMMEDMKKEMVQEIQKAEQRSSVKIDDLRGDIREIRQLLIQNLQKR